MLLCLSSHTICHRYSKPFPHFHTHSHTHTHTHTHLVLVKQFQPLLRSRCRDTILPPSMHADTHACTQTHTHTHKYMRTRTHSCHQRQSCEAEVTGLWFYAIFSKCSANCHSPTVREQRGSNMGPIWTPRWSHLLPTRGSCEERND